MTLFDKLESLIGLGWSVEFSSFMNQFKITVKRTDIKDNEYQRESSLPLRDHFYESRIIECIDWSIEEIEEEIKNKI